MNSSNPNFRKHNLATMVRRRFVLFLFFLAPIVASASPASCLASGQDTVMYLTAVERSFQDAMRFFEDHRYQTALAMFERIVDQPENTHRTSASYVMAAKSLYRLGEYPSSVALLRKFLDRFERSEYVADAVYTLGLDYYQLEQYKESARSFLNVCQISGDTALAARAEKMLRIAGSTNLAIPDLREVLGEASQPGTKALVTLLLAEKVLHLGDARGARELLGTVLELPATHVLVQQAQALLEKIDRSGVVKIGVVLPLSFKSDQASIQGLGQELLDGIRLAADEYNAESIPKVNLEVRDSERDADVAARQVSELSADDQILAIVGPVFSHEVFSSAGLASKKGIPIITPTATSVGIAAIGESVFQANPDFLMRGRAMAQYAILSLGARRLAVLSSSDTINKLIVEAFVREVKDLGGQFVGVQWYNPGQTDLRDELMALRKRAMELSEPTEVNFGGKLRPGDLKRMASWGVPQQTLDSLSTSAAVANVEFLFGVDGVRIADSLKIPTQRVRAKYDSLGYPVTGIDALFASIAGSEDIAIVTSQVRYFNFQTQLLGTGNWNDATELDQNRQYANGVIFAADAYWEEIDQQYQQFARQFRSKHSKNPSLNAMIGYDAMKLLLRTIRQGAILREDVVSALSKTQLYQGVHSKISFNLGRVNSCLTVLQFKGRVIKRIGEIDIGRKPIIGNE